MSEQFEIIVENTAEALLFELANYSQEKLRQHRKRKRLDGDNQQGEIHEQSEEDDLEDLLSKQMPTVPGPLLTGLYFIFGQTLVSALPLVDREMVSVLTCPKGRSLIQVIGDTGRMYTLLPKGNFCDCEAYKFRVVKAEALMCKHVLAARIAIALDAYLKKDITDKEYQTILCHQELDMIAANTC
eukprot:m.343303 g.343303  ORF g.343303 m.343303 type:complete len:185 (-) comp22662_c0_seq1:1347-1901(-)